MAVPGQPPGWLSGSATGVGSMPGTDPARAIAVVLDALPEFPHLPELPGRGPGADLIGRTAALLVDLPVETTPQGWKLTSRPGRDQRRAAGYLSADLDALQEAAASFDGTIKAQLCGPWTLAASLGLSRGSEFALADPGAIADLTASLAEGVTWHVAELRRRLPKASLVLQLDEPALPGVLAGSIPTASGWRRIAAVDGADAEAALRAIVDAAAGPVVMHCCAAQVPFALIRRAGAVAAAFDLALLDPADTDALAAAADAGLDLFAGAIPAVPAPQPGEERDAAAGGNAAEERQRDAAGAGGNAAEARQAAASVIRLCRRIGLPDASAAGRVVVTPACGLAGLSPARAASVLQQCRAAARLLPELIAEGVR